MAKVDKDWLWYHSDCGTPLEGGRWGTCPRCGFIPDMQSIEATDPIPPKGFHQNPKAQWCQVHGGWHVEPKDPCPKCKAMRESEG